MNYGITQAGFVRKPYSICLSEIQARMQDSEMFGNDVDLSDVQPHGVLSKLMAFSEDRMWQILEDLYYSLWISSAEGVSLDRAVRFGMIGRKKPFYATVDLAFTGEAGSFADKIQAETAQGLVFETHNVTIGEDGTVIVTAKCTVPGSAGIVAANTITRIKIPQSGFSTVTNPERSSGGRPREHDMELRTRYDELPQSTGSSVVAIMAALKNVEGVMSVSVAENFKLITDENGLPPVSIEAVVIGGDDYAIASVLAEKCAVNTYGNITVPVTDSQSILRQIRFSRAENVLVNVRFTVTRNPEWNDENIILIKRSAVQYIGGVDDTLTEYSGVGVSKPVKAWRISTLLDNISGVDNIQIEVSRDGINYSDVLTFLNRENPQTQMALIEVL